MEKQIPPYSWWKAEQVMDGIIYVIDIISWKLNVKFEESPAVRKHCFLYCTWIIINYYYY